MSILFDNDCGKLVVKKSVVERLKGIGRSKQTLPGPLELIGVGDKRTSSEHGEFAICLLMASGEQAILTGVSLTKNNSNFPTI